MKRSNQNIHTLIAAACIFNPGCDSPEDEEIFLRDGETTFSSDGGLTGEPEEPPDSCEVLTPAAYQEVIDGLDAAITKTQEHIALYPDPAPHHAANALQSFTTSRNMLLGVKAWLVANQIDSPFVSNTTGAFTTHDNAWRISTTMGYGEVYVALVAVYYTSTEAKAAAENAARATRSLAVLRAAGLNCYMRAYFQP